MFVATSYTMLLSVCMYNCHEQIVFTDLYKYAAGQSTPFSSAFIFPDMWIAYKKSQNILEDTMKTVKDVVVLTGVCVHCLFALNLLIFEFICTANACSHV
jgi:hypothetical protein